MNLTKLIGRDNEVDTLLKAYERWFSSCATTTTTSCDLSLEESNRIERRCSIPKDEMVVIRGKAGTGKTTLANRLRDAVQQDGGIFLVGKFECTFTQDPYAVFSSALAQFVDQVMNDDKKITSHGTHLRQAIRDAMLGDHIELLTKIFPSLQKLVRYGTRRKEQPPLRELEENPPNRTTMITTTGTESLSRFQYTCCKFFRAVASVTPLVLFLDDVQWSDAASLQLVQAILQSQIHTTTTTTTSHNEATLMIVCAVREDNVIVNQEDLHYLSSQSQTRYTISPFLDYLDQIMQMARTTRKHLNMTEIHLENLNEVATNELVAGILNTSPDSCHYLSNIVYAQCHGNPFRIIDIVKCLQSRTGEINVLDDPQQDLTESLYHRMLWSLPEPVLTALQISACLGDEIDEIPISIMLEIDTTEVTQRMEVACHEFQMVFRDSKRGHYRFAHDCTRQAVLSTIEDQTTLSYRIGYQLWTNASPMYLNAKMFLIASLLSLATNATLPNQDNRYQIASFLLEAAVKATSMAAFADSARYISPAIKMLQSADGSMNNNCWRDQYDLTLKLYTTAADTELCLQNFDRVMELADHVICHAKTLHDTLAVQVAKINAYGQNGSVQKAMELGLDLLDKLGERLPRRCPMQMAIALEVVKAKLSLRGCSYYDIMMLPHMENNDKLAAMYVMAVLLIYSYQIGDPHNPLMGTRIVRLCLKYGSHKYCALGFSTLGWITCGHDREEGYRLGLLALTMIDRWRAKELVPRVHMNFYGFVHHWKNPLRDTLEPLQNAANVGLEMGDIEYSMLALYFKCSHSLCCGIDLRQVKNLILSTVDQIQLYKQHNLLQLIKPSLQYVCNLQGGAADPRLLVGDILSPEDIPSDDDTRVLRSVHFFVRTGLAYMFGDYDLAYEYTEKRRNMKFEPFAVHSYTFGIQWEALTAIARGRLGKQRGLAYKLGRNCCKRMASWAKDCPQNFLYRKLLLEAELKTLKKCRKVVDRSVLKLYDESARLAQQEGFIQGAALASELAGDYVSRHHQSSCQSSLREARIYWFKAHELYHFWGATAKANQLWHSRNLGTKEVVLNKVDTRHSSFTTDQGFDSQTTL